MAGDFEQRLSAIQLFETDVGEAMFAPSGVAVVVKTGRSSGHKENALCPSSPVALVAPTHWRVSGIKHGRDLPRARAFCKHNMPRGILSAEWGF